MSVICVVLSEQAYWYKKTHPSHTPCGCWSRSPSSVWRRPCPWCRGSWTAPPPPAHWPPPPSSCSHTRPHLSCQIWNYYHHLPFLMSSRFLGDVIIQEVIAPDIVILEVFNPNVMSKQMSGTTQSCSECYHLTWNGVDLNVPSSCSTMTMSTAPVRVAVLMSLMLLTRPERKFILASDWSRVITRPGYWPLIGCSNFRIPK